MPENPSPNQVVAPEPPLSIPAPRRRGGQPGNKNRLKHGLYSKQISPEETRELESMPLDMSEFELALARVRLKTCLERQQTAPPENWLSYERAIAHYLRLITSLTYRNAVFHRDDKTAFSTVMEMIRQVNEEQNVK